MTAERAAALVSDLAIDPERPLLIVDADEVLFHFMAAFLAHIESHGHAYVFRSYALHGNVLERPGGDPLAGERVTELVQEFFRTGARTMPADPDAAAAIRRLQSDGAQAVVLSNVPANAAEDRRAALAEAGFEMELAPWSGPKGEAVKAMASRTVGGAAFIDDIAHHHESVSETAPDVYRLHYVTHPELRRLLGHVPSAHDQATSWPHLENLIRARFSL